MSNKSFSIVAAIDQNYGIGVNGNLPWKSLKVDMAHFKKVTTNGRNAVIMGRKTWESIPQKMKPLENRVNIVLSRTEYDDEERVELFKTAIVSNSLDEALRLAQSADRVFVIGGSELYKEAIGHPLCQKIILTRVFGTDPSIVCDAFFPKIVEGPNDWMLAESSKEVVDKSELVCLFQTYVQSNEEEVTYFNLIKRIIDFGEYKADRTEVGTHSIFGNHMRFSLRNNTVPLLTSKRVFWKGIVEELLWFISGNTDSKVLSKRGVKIWDANGSKEFLGKRGLNHREEGDLGPVYGFQWRHFGAKYTTCNADYTNQGIDQLQNCIDLIKKDPTSRRIIMSAWNAADLDEMALPPCHVLCQFSVSIEKKKLSCLVYQRSCDVGVGMPFNIASYALLTHMIASLTNLEAEELVYDTGDTHVYSDHVDELRKQTERIPTRFPKVFIEKREKIDDFVPKDIKLMYYSPNTELVKLKMAV